jgi:spore germination cell wall hydrolase CwlJ-like protein
MGVFAPWCLGVGLVVSMAANAGQDASVGLSVAPASVLAAAQPGNLIPVAVTGPGFGLDPEKPALTREAKLILGDEMDFTQMPDEIAPRRVLKPNAHGFPVIDRAHRGDPAVGLRPTFSSQLRHPGGVTAAQASQIIFAEAETFQTDAAPPGFAPAAPPRPDAAASLPNAETPTTAATTASISPPQTGSVETTQPAEISERVMQGATPEVGRADVLASATPAPADATPVEIVVLPTSPDVPSLDAGSQPDDRPNYASLIGEDQWRQEQHCLAQAIYFEARGESDKGQAAVAQVVLNRVSSGLYPSTICGVVFQNRQHYHACQFSFACEGRSLRITEVEAWRRAQRIAAAVTDGKTYLADVGEATHYHAVYVHPYWARRLERTDRIGHHIFYKMRPGET